MATYGTLLKLLAINGNLWYSRAIYGNLWNLMTSRGILCQLMAIYANLWQSREKVQIKILPNSISTPAPQEKVATHGQMSKASLFRA